jgi:hypothetical protein
MQLFNAFIYNGSRIRQPLQLKHLEPRFSIGIPVGLEFFAKMLSLVQEATMLAHSFSQFSLGAAYVDKSSFQMSNRVDHWHSGFPSMLC